MYIKCVAPFNVLVVVHILTHITIRYEPLIQNQRLGKICSNLYKTYQNDVATISPAPIQSTKITYNKNLINCIKLNLKTKANAIDDTKTKILLSNTLALAMVFYQLNNRQVKLKMLDHLSQTVISFLKHTILTLITENSWLKTDNIRFL